MTRFILFLLCAILISIPSTVVAQKETSIVAAAEKSDWKTVESKLASGVNPNTSQPDGMTVLHWATFHGKHDLVKQLVESKANVNALTIYKVSPLSLACETGDKKSVRLLLAAKADRESKRMGGERPLMIAARLGDAEIIRELLNAGASVDAKEARGQTALMWAAAEGHLTAVDELIKAGATIDMANASEFSAFMFAARQGKTDVVKRLIDAGVDVNSVMNPKRPGGRSPRTGTSALMLAIESGHFELALELVKLGANPNDQRSGFAPLHAVTWVRKTKRGDDPDGDPAPRGSGAVNSIDFVRAMVDLGANVNLQIENGKSKGKAKLNSKGATPFLYASATADVPLMKLLIELGADPKLNNADGCTPLMAAAGVGVVAVGEEPGTEEEVDEAIKYLVELGIDPNVVDKNGETAMHGAAYRNFPSAVRLLTTQGADPNVWNKKNKHNWTPHKIAEGYRPGSFKPSPATIAALDEAMPGKKSTDE
ncbi:MAG: ankyrin repeat domain-containing protein [Mariniblastus sp.]